MSQVVLLSLTASLNPTLVAATTVMLLLDKPARLMGGYLLGAYVASITLGLVIVFSLSGTSASNTTENTISPAVDIGLGAIALAVAFVLYTGRHERLRERRQARKAAKPDQGPPRWQRELSKGSARTTFVVGALLSLPGASYLAGLDECRGRRAPRDQRNRGTPDLTISTDKPPTNQRKDQPQCSPSMQCQPSAGC